jgi:phosphate transport system protein
VNVVELRVQFHRQMEEIEGKIIQLFAYISEDLAGATDALLSGDNAIAKALAERERTIDRVYQELEKLLNEQFALQAPVARDLRFLLSALRIVPELERSHDLVAHIARYADHGLSHEMSPRSRGLVERMGQLGSEMWCQAADCWHDRDGEAALLLDERDEEMDGLHAALVAELAAGRMSIPVIMDMTLVSRFYERLGDHAVNVARRVVYLAGIEPSAPVSGRDAFG